MKNTQQHRNWISRMRLPAASAALALAAVLVLAVIATQPAKAQTYTVLASFDGTNGSYSLAPLVQATDGNLYGTTDQAQDGSGYGTIFDITTSGTLTSLYTFCPNGPPPGEFCQDGQGAVAGLVQATNGDLYGTTNAGGPNSSFGDSYGSVFKITLPNDAFTSLYGFPIADGSADEVTAGLIQATNGYLYGATGDGGVNAGGSVFSITEGGGPARTIYSFCSNPSLGVCDPGTISSYDGDFPVAGLIQATNGDLYGTTEEGGINNGGTVFKIAGKKLTVLYRFCSQINASGTCTDGSNPSSVLVQATNGNLYGTTAEGGTGAFCPVFYGCGTIFEITPTGGLTTLYSFCSQSSCADGTIGGNLETPTAALIQASDGNFYGTTPYGGDYYGGPSGDCGFSYGCGTIFQITPGGTLTTLYNFCSQSGCADGGEPNAGLVQDTNGTFYGTTPVANGTVLGTVYSLFTGLGPFIETQPVSGKVGTAVNILGTDLTGATSVTFNGLEAAFNVVSSSEITATVPMGATAGYVTVTTPSGTLTTNVAFLLSTTLIATTTTLTSSPNPSVVGEPVTFTAVVSSGAGAPPNGETISFQKGATVLGTGTLSGGSASFTTSTLSVGTTWVKAVYGADAYFKKSTSNVVKQVVDKAAN
jgi:uncharacterized repeat protein (TIGR03803 family)